MEVDIVSTGASRRVLIIEDHNDVADLEKLLCQMEGYDVRVAKDGDHGWREVLEFHPDLVLLDLMLPGTISGHDILQRMQDKAGDGMPKVIVVSALMNSKTTARVMKPGQVETMEKPFTINALADRMKSLLAASPAPS